MLFQFTTVNEMDASVNVRGFSIIDYVIFAVTITVSLGIGLYYAFTGGKQRTAGEFLMGDKKLSTLPVTLSILVSYVSAIMVLGTPAEMYTRGTQLVLRTVGYCLACMVSSVLLVPLFYSLNITSSFEYLERRFNSKFIRLCGTVMMLIGNAFYMGLVMFTPSTALETATGFPLVGSVIITGFVATVYTSIGGMKAVVWTDAFQALVMMGGMLAIVIQGCIEVGGIKRVWNLSYEGGRIQFFDFDPDPTKRLTFWSTVIGGMFHTLIAFGVGQTSVQRYCSLPSLKKAKRSVFMNIPALLIVNALACLVGLVVYAYYADKQCDPLKNGTINNSNQLVPFFVTDVLNYPGIPGIFLAVLFSGALSSMSSSLNAASAVTWEDMLKPFYGHFSELKKTVVMKVIVVVYGLVAMGLAFLARAIGGHVLWASISFTGASSGPSLGVFLLGAFFPWANAKGAITGFFSATAFILWIAIGSFINRPYPQNLPTSTDGCNSTTLFLLSNCTKSPFINDTNDQYDIFSTLPPTEDPSVTGITRLYGLSFLWYSATGSILTIIVGLIVSACTGPQDPSKLDDKLIVPVFDWACCCLPRSWRQTLHCGVQYKKSVSDDPMTVAMNCHNKGDNDSDDPTEGINSTSPLTSASTDEKLPKKI